MLNLLDKWREKRQRLAIAEDLHAAMMTWSRQPAFFRDGGVPDTIDGRFDMIVLHIVLLLRALRHENTHDAAQAAVAKALSQDIFDVMVRDFDRSLREMGIGDQGVSPRVKKMIKAFYGRVEAYETALDNETPAAALIPALQRNLYRNTTVSAATLEQMSNYVLRVAADLQASDFVALLQARLPAMRAAAFDGREG